MHYDLVEDISRKNDVLSIAVSPTLRLAAAVWTVSVSVADSISNARLNCLGFALGKLVANGPLRELWLIAGHYSWQPDNRITRHNGFWKSLAKGGIVLPQGDFVDEAVMESKDGLRAFGAVRFGLNQLEAIHSVMQAAQAAIIFVPKAQSTDNVSSVVRHGWAMSNTKPPEEILEAVCAQSGLVVDVYGEFDDREVSVAAVGKRDVIGEMCS
jgi:hypothetical protein